MRKLSSLEKEILDKLINSPALKEQGLILCAKFLEDNYIGKDFEMSLLVKCSTKQVFMSIPKKKQDFDEFQRKKTIFIITFFNLIKDLQDGRRLYLIGDDDKEGILGPEFEVKVNFAPDLNSIICDTFFKLIYVSEDLIDFVKNDFQTVDELQHKENLKVASSSLEEARKSVTLSEKSLHQARQSVSRATIAIWVSVLLALISISSAFYISNLQAKNETKLNNKQFIELTNKLDSVTKNLEKVKQEIGFSKMPDTLKTVVIEPIELKGKIE